MAATPADRPLATSRATITRLRAARSSRLTALAFAAALVAASTVLVALVTPAVPAEAAGVFYLLAVLGASSLYGLGWGLGTSFASALAFNFFFLPPEHTLVIDSSSDWLALAAFVVTATVTSNLAARERRGREEAARRAEEARLGEAFATLIATAPDLDGALDGLADQAARALGAESGTIVRGADAAGTETLALELGDRRLGGLRLGGCPPGVLESATAQRVARNLAGLIALGEERERRIREQVHAEALLRSDELKTALLRAVSHDLRSPLQAITAAAGGLRFATLEDDERELVETIGDESGRMSRMIENLIDLSRLNAGAVRPAQDWLDPRELVEAAIDELSRGGPQTRVRVRMQPNLPLVSGDGPQLQRVVVNLIENALKFSPADRDVDVGVSPAEGTVEIAVADRGPGVSADEVERIFEPFYRSRGSRDVPGSGLGLAIARGLATANGCRLRVDRAPGRGSTFVLAMPVSVGEPAA